MTSKDSLPKMWRIRWGNFTWFHAAVDSAAALVDAAVKAAREGREGIPVVEEWDLERRCVVGAPIKTPREKPFTRRGVR